MVFSSHIFLFYFLPLALFAYHASPRPLRMPVLTAVSFIFYGWTNPWFVLLITYSTLVDAQAGQLSLQMICMPVQDNEFALQPRNYLAARPEPYVFPVMEKIKKWSLTGETLAAPAVPDCREAR